jgi:hypothetical protein
VHGGGTGGAGVLDPGRGLEAEIVIGLQHQAGGEILRRETGVEMPEIDFVDVRRLEPGMLDRLPRDAGDQAFDGLVAVFAKGRMGPADDAGSHDLLSRESCPCWRAF